MTHHSVLPSAGLDAYLHTIQQQQWLSVEEETQLATAWRSTQDLDAARQLVMSHLRFVVKMARQLEGYGLSQLDLIQEGSLGLMQAVKRFDPTRGVRLAAFASHWIKAYLYDYVLKNWRIVKVATTKAQKQLFFALRRLKKTIGWMSEKEVNDVAQTLSLSCSDVTEMEARLYAQDATIMPTDALLEEPTLILEDTAETTNPAHAVEAHDDAIHQHTALHNALKNLPEREAAILRARHLDEEKQTLSALATRYGVSLERVRQLEKKALKTLKEAL